MIYNSQQNKYLIDWIKSRIDFSNRIPDKFMKKEPLPRGLYGYTWLGNNQMRINDNLSYEQNQKTQLHECIHTNDEYETRRWTDWMLDAVKKIEKIAIEKYKKVEDIISEKYSPEFSYA